MSPEALQERRETGFAPRSFSWQAMIAARVSDLISGRAAGNDLKPSGNDQAQHDPRCLSHRRPHGVIDGGVQLPVRDWFEQNRKGMILTDPVDGLLFPRAGDEDDF